LRTKITQQQQRPSDHKGFELVHDGPLSTPALSCIYHYVIHCSRYDHRGLSNMNHRGWHLSLATSSILRPRVLIVL